MNGHQDLPHDLLLHLAPPTRLIDWLERVFEDKRKQGQEVPAEYVEWLKTWADIRGDGQSAIDAATPAQWAAVGEKVRG